MKNNCNRNVRGICKPFHCRPYIAFEKDPIFALMWNKRERPRTAISKTMSHRVHKYSALILINAMTFGNWVHFWREKKREMKIFMRTASITTSNVSDSRNFIWTPIRNIKMQFPTGWNTQNWGKEMSSNFLGRLIFFFRRLNTLNL